LASVDPTVFVGKVLTLDPTAQSSVFAVFKGRYDGGQLDADLQPEKVWLRVREAELLKAE
jgi:hypothetical protein